MLAKKSSTTTRHCSEVESILLGQNTTLNWVTTREQKTAVLLLCCQGQPLSPTVMFRVSVYLSGDQFHLAHGAYRETYWPASSIHYIPPFCQWWNRLCKWHKQRLPYSGTSKNWYQYYLSIHVLESICTCETVQPRCNFFVSSKCTRRQTHKKIS